MWWLGAGTSAAPEVVAPANGTVAPGVGDPANGTEEKEPSTENPFDVLGWFSYTHLGGGMVVHGGQFFIYLHYFYLIHSP